LLFRYLRHLDYKVRYVRNITDVGHLENDADSGDDKIGKKARLEQIEPMEVAQYYADSYHPRYGAPQRVETQHRASCFRPYPEQQEMVSKILEKGFAYISNGSVYFDVAKYNEQHTTGNSPAES
jgi:cysteinyl-tRNA synthetase